MPQEDERRRRRRQIQKGKCSRLSTGQITLYHLHVAKTTKYKYCHKARRPTCWDKSSLSSDFFLQTNHYHGVMPGCTCILHCYFSNRGKTLRTTKTTVHLGAARTRWKQCNTRQLWWQHHVPVPIIFWSTRRSSTPVGKWTKGDHVVFC